MNNLLATLIVSLLLFASCTKPLSKSQESNNTSNTSALDWKPLTFDCLVLKSKIDIKTKDNDVHATANIRIKKDSIIWISVTPGMGIEIIRSIITPDSVKIINRLDNKYEKYSITYLKETVGVDLNFYNLQNLLVGDLLLPLHAEDMLSDKPSEDVWEVIQKRNALFSKSIISKSQKKVRLLDAKNQEGKSIKSEYANFALIDSIVFHQSQKLMLVNDKDSSFVEVNHQKIEFTSKDISFPFSVPKKYEK